MRWTRRSRQTNVILADGEVVWSWPPDAEAKLARDDLADDGSKKARFPGRARRTPLKPPRREGRLFGQTCGNCRQLFYLLAGHGCGLHPAFPAPSQFWRARAKHHSDAMAPRDCGLASSWLFDIQI